MAPQNDRLDWPTVWAGVAIFAFMGVLGALTVLYFQ